MNREDLNKVAINDLYDREDSIQKSIFYYNNEILNKFVNKMVRKPQKHKNPLVRDEESQYNAPPECGQRGLATYSSSGRINFAPQNPLGINDE